jgi:hypothetical protein
LQALSRVYLLDAAQTKAAEAALAGRPILEEELGGHTDWVERAGGALFAGRRAQGRAIGVELWMKTASGWAKQEVPGSARGVVEAGGRPFAMTSEGLFAFDGTAWTLVSPPLDVHAAAANGDSLYLAAGRSVVRWRDGRVEKRVLKGEHVSDLSVRDGRLYASTTRGVYSWQIEERKFPILLMPLAWLGAQVTALWTRGLATGFEYWKPFYRGAESRFIYDDRGEPTGAYQVPMSVRRSVRAGGEEYVLGVDGLYRRGRDGGWVKDTPSEEVHGVVEAEGRLYAATEFGLHRRDERGWTLLLGQPFAGKLSYHDGILYFSGAGVRSWPLRAAAGLQGWDERAVSDLAPLAAEAEAPAEPAKPVEADYREDDGGLTDEEGRSVFF